MTKLQTLFENTETIGFNRFGYFAQDAEGNRTQISFDVYSALDDMANDFTAAIVEAAEMENRSEWQSATAMGYSFS